MNTMELLVPDLSLSREKIAETLEEIDSKLTRWQRRLAHSYTPAKGSELAEDDREWPYLAMSQLACAGLGSARDHANAVLKLQSADGSSPYAQPSLIRAALIGACQAVWLLAPDERAVRMKRFRVVLRESQSRHGSVPARSP